jgi:hypothetical protein
MTQPSPDSQIPQASDATLGGQNPAPQQSGILGGLDGIRQKLKSDDLSIRLEALGQALDYGEAGRVCLQEAANDGSRVVRNRAQWLLRQKAGTALAMGPVWSLTERLAASNNTQHASQFANREIKTFDPEEPLGDPAQVVYALRCEYDDDISMSVFLNQLLDAPGSERIEALVFGLWEAGDGVCTGDASAQRLVDLLVAVRDRLPNLKALFIGDIIYEESEISWLVQSDMSPILAAYPQLEILQVRGGTGLKFDNAARHENLKALILETGGLSRETVHQVYAWDFPALEHLEFWFGSENYGGDCWEQDLSPVLEDLCFPRLIYLGLRNSKFTNEMMERVVNSPILQGLQVLDLSMGTLADEGAIKLLDCPAARDLETLNVSQSYLSGAMIDQLIAADISLMAVEQREEEADEDPEYRRYCVVAE